MLYVPYDHGDVAVGCDARRALERALDAAREFIEAGTSAGLFANNLGHLRVPQKK
jgi:hypothetical protein